jgi:predicted ATPase/transcriptional regulator with XRE-family HTH domain
MSAFGVLLRRHREDAQLTQEELAALAGVSARTISDIERGVRSRAYADTATRLTVALGLRGTEQTSFLHTARGRPPPGSATSASPGIPRPLTRLIGRERELAGVVNALGAGGSRLLALTGLGGVGKTRLALAAAAELEPSYGGRLHFVPIAPNQDPGLLMEVLASHVGVTGTTSRERVAAHIAGHPTLLVLDSFEHVVAATADIEGILLAAPKLQLLVTSRLRLGITGEQELALLPLPVPDRSDPRWPAAPSVALFLERAHAVRPDLHVDPDVVVDICRRVSGVPLALELAAARVRHLPLTVLRDRLQAGMGDLSDPGTRGTGRHRSMEQTLAWSTGSLTPEEMLMLQVGALFPGGWRLDAAVSVCGDSADVVRATSGLVDNGLVLLEVPSQAAAMPRWRMLDVVRQFVSGSAYQVEPSRRYRVLSFYLDLLAEVETSVGREHEWFELLSTEEANVRASLSWAADDHDAETVLRLSNGMWQFWQTSGQLSEGRRWLELGLALRPDAADGTRSTALWGLGWLAYHQGDDTVAEGAARELAGLAARLADDKARRNALTILGMVAISHEHADDAVALLEEALRIARGLGRGWFLATSLLNLGLGHLSAGDTTSARIVLGEALAVYERLGDERFHARCLGYLGMASLLEDDPHRAQGLFAQSLGVFGELGEPGGTAEGLVGLAAVNAAMGQLTRAAILAGAAERLRDSYAARELPLDRRTNGRYLASAEVRLGAKAWADAWARGRNLSLEHVIHLALTGESE